MRKNKIEKLAEEVEILIDLKSPIKEVTMAYEHYMDMTGDKASPLSNYVSKLVGMYIRGELKDGFE